MAQAPFCAIDPVFNPPADPGKNKGLTKLPGNATLTQVINIVNNNFNKLIKGNYVENKSRRAYTITRIFDPQDTSIYVDVRQITTLHFDNNTTGQTIIWNQ